MTSESTLLANADAALYRAKDEGRGSIRFFEADMDKRLRERRALQQDLRSAIERNELELHYQPQARIGGEIIGFEALVRWHHPQRGMIPPSTFIPLAEESGLIMQMGEWVLREACRRGRLMAERAADRRQPLAGAVPARRPADAGARILLETGLPPERLELEITEGVLDRRLQPRRFDPAPAEGVGRAHRDGRLRHRLFVAVVSAVVPVRQDQDRPHIRGQSRASNPQSAAIIRAVIGLGHGLNLPVVAEGVETEEQRAFLTREACDQVQGYLLGRPRPIEDYAEVVGRTQTHQRELQLSA